MLVFENIFFFLQSLLLFNTKLMLILYLNEAHTQLRLLSEVVIKMFIGLKCISTVLFDVSAVSFLYRCRIYNIKKTIFSVNTDKILRFDRC